MTDLPPRDTDTLQGAASDPIDPQTQDLRAALRENDEQARRDTRNIPPLAWIVVLLLVVVGAVAYFYSNGDMGAPRGGEAPAAADQPASAPINP